MGLDTSPGRFLFKKPDTFEQSISIAQKAIAIIRESKTFHPEAPLVWVFDSLASMVPQQKLEKDVADFSMHDNYALAKAGASVWPTLALVAEKFNVLFIFLNQIRTKPGIVYGDPTTSPGGDTFKFYASIRLQLGAKKITVGKGDDAVVIGQEVTARTVKNKVNRPFLKAKWRFMYAEDGTGYFDRAGSLINFAAEKGVLETAGNYVIWTDNKKYYPSALIKKVEEEGLLPELEALFAARSVEVDEIDAKDKEALKAVSE
jgi:recombination protein RecA